MTTHREVIGRSVDVCWDKQYQQYGSNPSGE